MPFNVSPTNRYEVRSTKAFQLQSDEGKNWRLIPYYGDMVASVDETGAIILYPDSGRRVMIVEEINAVDVDNDNFYFQFVGREWEKEMTQSLWEMSEFSLKKFKWGKLAAEKRWRNVIEYLVCDTTLKPSERLAIKLWLAHQGVLELNS